MTYIAESLHPYIMNDRIKAASGSGGIGNIPIASADTVGGVKIGEGINVTEDGTISTTINMLSNTDYLTNKTLNGRPVYMRHINLEAAVGNRNVLTDVNEMLTCNLKIITAHSEIILPKYNLQYSSEFSYQLNTDTHTIEYKTTDNNSSYAMTGYIEYTKSEVTP